MKICELLQALYDKGCVSWQADIASEDAAVIALIPRDGSETVVNLFMQHDTNSVIVGRQLTDNMDITDRQHTVSLLYISLATANSELVDHGLLGCCQLHSAEDCISVVYTAALPLLEPAVTAELILTALQGILFVEPYFGSIITKAASQELDVDDVFSFYTEPVVTLHPALKVSRRESAALSKWLRETGMSMRLVLNMVSGCPMLDIYFVATDDTVTIYASTGKTNIKLDELRLPDAKDQRILDERVHFCWNVYRAIAGYAGANITNEYDSCEDFLFELYALFW